MNRPAIEDYLKTIYVLTQHESPVTTSRIAAARQVSAPSVSNMLRRLHNQELVNYRKHYGVTLTAKGEIIALEILRHHRLLELYLTQELGFGWDEVHDEADVLEHVISEKFEEQIAARLKHPVFDPHGQPIPAKDGTMVQVDCHPLTQLAEGDIGTVWRIDDDTNGALLRYLDGLGLVPGTAIEIAVVAPFEGPVTVTINDESVVVGHKAAATVYIKKH